VTELSTFAELLYVDHGLCVFTTLRGDGSVQASVVNAGVLPHPLTGVCRSSDSWPSVRAFVDACTAIVRGRQV
jgi:hypothetical protein